MAQHHRDAGLLLVALGQTLWACRPITRVLQTSTALSRACRSPHGLLGLALALLGSLSIAQAQNSQLPVVYPALAGDYTTLAALFDHHMLIGAILVLGSTAHASIFVIHDLPSTPLQSTQQVHAIANHRDTLLGHLFYVSTFLGFHAFGPYIHNDLIQALSRPSDQFNDASLGLKPLLAQAVAVTLGSSMASRLSLAQRTHSFITSTPSASMSRSLPSLLARSSRLVPDKAHLGFRYPCDGPGRGGTCQVSGWDHVYLGVFWAYNTLSVALFHASWKLQSDAWGSSSASGFTHLSGGDYSLHSTSVNGWLRYYLWSQASQVIQSYGSSLSAYGVLFLGAHFLWALSLMFLFSGRGYWQELIESLLWAHIKLRVVPLVQPRALSIQQGRAVGVLHFYVGGVGCTWAFQLARMTALA